VYLTYAATNDAGESATHVGSGQLSLAADDSPALDGFEALHVAEPFVDSDLPLRLAGDVRPGRRAVRHSRGSARHQFQPGPRLAGPICGARLDSSAHFRWRCPPDNLFVDDAEAADAIYSYGHRNPQAMAVRPETGAIWQCEHGEEDGDEINVIERGGNYGWPVASEACRYGTDERVAPSHRERSDVVAPVTTGHAAPAASPSGGPSSTMATPSPTGAVTCSRGRSPGGISAVHSRGCRCYRHRGDRTRLPLADRDWRIRSLAVEPATGHLYVAVDDADAPIARIVPV